MSWVSLRSVCLSVYLSVCLSICLAVWLSDCLSACQCLVCMLVCACTIVVVRCRQRGSLLFCLCFFGQIHVMSEKLPYLSIRAKYRLRLLEHGVPIASNPPPTHPSPGPLKIPSSKQPCSLHRPRLLMLITSATRMATEPCVVQPVLPDAL